MKLLPEENTHCLLCSPLTCFPGDSFPSGSFHILLQNLHQFLRRLSQRHFVLVYVAESMTGLSASAFNTRGVLCIWPWPITLGTLWR